MPKLSLADRLARLERTHARPRLTNTLFEVRTEAGEVILRTGGLWDGRRYVAHDPAIEVRPHVVTLERSQVPLAKGFARWLDACRRGDDARPILLMAGGNRGSGKTFFLAGVVLQVIALEWPGDEQLVTNINLDNRRECIHHLELAGRSEWIAYHSDDLRSPYTEFVTGSRVTWLSARNPKKLRVAGLPIRHVLINEGQVQPEDVYVNAQSAGRNLGGIVTIAHNPPQTDGGNWVARAWFGIEAGEIDGERYLLRNVDNAKVSHAYLDKAGQAIRVVSPLAAAADVDGEMKLAGPIAYRTFDGRPYNHADPMAGGHVGEPPDVGWRDVTRELTAEDMGGGRGADVAIGSDFQSHPGCVGDVARIYRTPSNALVLYIDRQVAVPGQEDAYSQALLDAGYTANGYRDDGTPGPLALLIGDATGARQNAEHRKAKPPSYHAMKANGWVIKPPMLHHKSRIPWNPDVRASLDQMFVLFERRQIVISPRCKEALNGFPSLVDSFRNAKRSSNGKLSEEGGFQHGPDGVRYLAWRYLPRPKPVAPSDRVGDATDLFQGVKLFTT